MRGLLFIGGYKADNTVFALITEDEKKDRTCHMFKWNAQVLFPLLWGFMCLTQPL